METASITPATLNEKDAALYLGVSVAFLRVSRMRTPRSTVPGPVFLKAGKRGVRYLLSDLDAWLTSRRVVRVA